MKPLGPERDHYWLALRMAKAAGVDLQAAIETGHFDQKEWSETVHNCRGCEWSGECKHWLGAHTEIEAAPETCVNASLFATLKAAQQETEAIRETRAKAS